MKFLLSVLLVGCLSWQVHAQETDRETASKIVALERVGKFQACQNKDLKTLDSMLDEDFVSVDEEGMLMTKAQMLIFVQAANFLKYLPEEMAVKLHGDTAIVTGVYQVKGAVKGRPFEKHVRFIDTWIRKTGGWVSIASLSTPAM